MAQVKKVAYFKSDTAIEKLLKIQKTWSNARSWYQFVGKRMFYPAKLTKNNPEISLAR